MRNLVVACLVVAALTGCGTQAQVARMPVTELREARFGGDADTLLVTQCPPVPEGEEIRCRILRVELKTQTSVAYEAGPNESLEYPSPTSDGKGIMAVRAPRQRDAGGNRPNEIVTSGIDDPRVTLVYRHPSEILNPRRADDGIIFWSRWCQGPTSRYCEKEPMFRRADGRVHLVERSYKFAIAGPILRWRGSTYAEAESPAESFLSEKYSNIQMDAGYPHFFKLDASKNFGMGRVGAPLTVLMGGANDASSLILMASGEKDIGLYRYDEGRTERIGFVPRAIYPLATGYRIALDVSPRTEKVSLIMAHQEDTLEHYRISLFDTTSKTWRPVKLPVAKVVRTLSVAR